MGRTVIVYHVPAFDPESPVVDMDEGLARVNTPDLLMQCALMLSITSWGRYYDSDFVLRCAPANLEQVRECLRRATCLAAVPVFPSEPDLAGYDHVLEVLTPYSLARGPLEAAPHSPSLGPVEAAFDLVADADSEYVYYRPGSSIPLLKTYLRHGGTKARVERIEDVAGIVDFYAPRGDENFEEMSALMHAALARNHRDPCADSRRRLVHAIHRAAAILPPTTKLILVDRT